MTEDNNNTDKNFVADSEEQQKKYFEALGESISQKSGEAADEEDHPDTSDYDDGFIPARFRSESRSTGERRAREGSTNNDE